jgi:Na+-transporting methylmalonyl-CoA/oxaloacetate decarboxylase gamma subunit
MSAVHGILLFYRNSLLEIIVNKVLISLSVLVACMSVSSAFAADTKVEEKTTTEKAPAHTKHVKKVKETKTDAAGDVKTEEKKTKTETK